MGGDGSRVLESVSERGGKKPELILGTEKR